MAQRSWLALVSVLLSASCVSVSGPSRLSLKSMAVSPPSLMIATKSQRTAFIVLDDAKAPREMPILVGGKDRGGRLDDTQSFVERDLKRAFENYFRNVQVVSPGTPLGNAPHVVIDVKLDRIEVIQTARRKSGVVTYHAGAASLTWGLGVRPSESSEYLYSFAGESVGAPGEDPMFVFRSMFEAGITDMLKGYTDKKVHEKVLELRQSSPALSAKPTGI